MGTGIVNNRLGINSQAIRLSKAAVIKFQKDRNLVADAIVSAKTWEKLSHVVTFDADIDNFLRQHFFFSLEYVA